MSYQLDIFMLIKISRITTWITPNGNNAANCYYIIYNNNNTFFHLK